MTRLRNDQLSEARKFFTDNQLPPPYDFELEALALILSPSLEPTVLTCEDYDPDDEPEPGVELINLPSFDRYALDNRLMRANVAGIADMEAIS